MLDTTQSVAGGGLYCSFWLGPHCFAVPAVSVREVHAPAPVTPVAGAPPAVRGYVNLRGQLYLVLDPGDLLLDSRYVASAAGELIVFRADIGESFAIHTDQVGEIVTIRTNQIHLPKSRTDEADAGGGEHNSEHLIVGHATLDTQLITLIAPWELLPTAFAGDSLT